MEKQFGKITSARYGFGGYQDAQFGLAVTLEGKNFNVADFRGNWCMRVAYNNNDDHSWRMRHVEGLEVTFNFLNELLMQSQAKCVDELAGTPVEVVFDDKGKLHSWRVMTEVL